MKRIEGRWALVTGASSGLGSDFARGLATRGCNLILVARREDRLRELQRELSERHAIDVRIMVCDLAMPNAAQVLYDRVHAEALHVDILINNAGFGLYGDFIETPWDRELQMLQLNVVNLVHLTKLFVRDMLDAGFGHVLQVASAGAYQPLPTYASYTAAKSFVLHFSEAISYELRKTPVRVTVLCPGVTATEFLQVAGQKATPFLRLTMMQSAQVAEIGIRAMLRGRSSVVAGLLNTALTFSLRFVPRWWMTLTGHLVMKQPD